MSRERGMEALLESHPDFAAKVEGLVSSGEAEWGTLMGFPCLRVNGAFFATAQLDRLELVVKLPAPRVTELIEEGVANPFAPAGRTFKEWVAVPDSQGARWVALLNEARAFVAG